MSNEMGFGPSKQSQEKTLFPRKPDKKYYTHIVFMNGYEMPLFSGTEEECQGWVDLFSERMKGEKGLIKIEGFFFRVEAVMAITVQRGF